MGCCFSAAKVTAPPPVAVAQIPVPPVEEESIKEVVVQCVSLPLPLEVSVPDLTPPAVLDCQAPEGDHPLATPEGELPLATPEGDLPRATSEGDLPLATPEISHKSDICSISHSFSTATTATASVLDDDALSKPHRPLPPSRRSTNVPKRPNRVSRSPGERHSPQAKRVPLHSRLEASRERTSRPTNPTNQRRNAVTGSLPHSGLLNGPSRRSRSPATRGPSSGARGAATDGRRSPMKKRDGEVQKVDVKGRGVEVDKDVEVVKKEDVAAKETIENPEVSMECFIFL